MIFDGDQTLAVRRPDDDDELPGIWGLAAGTCRGHETVEDVIKRIGRDKLGVNLVPVRKLASGAQDREKYRLEMELWEARMARIDELPERPRTYSDWKWDSVDLLRPGAASGSLCCQLAIQSKSRVS